MRPDDGCLLQLNPYCCVSYIHNGVTHIKFSLYNVVNNPRNVDRFFFSKAKVKDQL